MRIGVISDTHGQLRPEAVERLAGLDHIVHAGDIGARDIVPRLAAIAPTTAVRGNVDCEPWARGLPAAATLQFGCTRLYVLHDRAGLDFDPAALGYDAVIFGHSHRPSSVMENGVLMLNPGSAGPRRFSLPVTLALLEIATDGELRPLLVRLPV